MKAKIHRIIYTSAAIILGICIVLALSLAGDKSHGPIENLLLKLNSIVQNGENTFIIKARTVKRSDKLNWFQSAVTGRDLSLLKNPKIILLGAHDNQAIESFQSILDLEDSLRTTFPLIHIYQAWGTKEEEQFPKMRVESILELGSVPVITWEPWLCDFDAKNYPNLRNTEVRDNNGLADVAKGAYDAYIRQWADGAKEIKQPILLRFGHEMNDPYRYPWGPQNNTPKEFVAAWKHIHKIFVQEGATNVLWIWSPHPAYDYFNAFYPGSEYVDYVGVGILNFGTIASWSKWWSFEEMFGNHYEELASFKKPIMITEFGSLTCGGVRSEWFKDALAKLPFKYPLLKAILFFHVSEDKTLSQQSLSWYIKYDTLSTHTIIKQIKGHFYFQGSDLPLCK